MGLKFTNRFPQIIVQVFIEREMGDNNSELQIIPAYFGTTRRQFDVIVYTDDNGETTEYFIPKQFGDFVGITNARKILRKWCPNGKRIGDFNAVQNGPRHSVFNDPQTLVVAEDELYIFFMKCNNCDVEPFLKWVCSVLKQIRKTGFYAMPGVNIPPQQLAEDAKKLIDDMILSFNHQLQLQPQVIVREVERKKDDDPQRQAWRSKGGKETQKRIREAFEENKQLKLENRELKRQLDIYQKHEENEIHQIVNELCDRAVLI